MTCPSCGGRLELVTDGQVGVEVYDPALPYPHIRQALESRPFLACSGCEFCAELPSMDDSLIGRGHGLGGYYIL